MNAIWLILVIYAVAEAIAAAYRVRQKRRLGTSALPSATRFKQSQRSPEQPVSSTAVQASPDLASPDLKSSDLEIPDLESPDLDRLHQSSNQSDEGSSLLQAKSSAEIDLPLAVSLSISEVVHPEMRSPSEDQFELDLVSPEFTIAELETAKPASHEQQSVLAEISQLDQAELENTIAQFQRHLNHPDDTIRAASVFELGEVAAKYRGAKADEVREMLMQLSQDPNPSIRTQVVIALAKIESVTP